MSEEIDFAPMMEGVARELWGQPNERMSKPNELRWGDSGRRSVVVDKGTWYDNGTKEGGGVLALIKREAGLEGAKAFEWLKQRGFTIPDRDQPQQHSQQAAQQPRAKVTATWAYTDEAGKRLYEVQRVEDGTFDPETKKPNKTFRQRHHDPKDPAAKSDGWVWSLKGVRRVLYRLPAVLEAVKAGRTIYLVEGEKACDAAVKLGLDATTAGMGAGKWDDGYTAALTGADVVVVPDNDDQGENHAQVVGAALRGKAKSVRVLRLPDLPPKGDIYDWVGQGGTLSRIQELTEQAPSFRPAPPISRFGAVEWRCMDEPGVEFEYRVQGLLAKRGTAVIAGPSGSGKSFLATDMGFAIARGDIDYYGRFVEQGLVLFQAGEGGVGLKKRMRAYKRAHQLDRDIPFVLLPGELDLHSGDEHTDAFIAEGRAWSAYYEQPVAVVFVDTLAAATPGANENDSGDVSKVLARCTKIAHGLDCLVVLVHHLNAAGDKLRGHTSLRANVDNVLLVNKGELKDSAGRYLRKVEVQKDKEGEDGTSFQFVLRQILLGQDKHGADITSCIVQPPAKGDGEQQAMERVRLVGNDLIIYQALQATISNEGLPVPPGLRVPAQVKQVAAWGAFCAEVRRKMPHVPDMMKSPEENEKTHAETVRKAIQRSVPKMWHVMGRDMDLKVVWDLGLPRYTRQAGQSKEEAVEQAVEERKAVDDVGLW